MTQGQIPIIGVGGISSGADAYEKIKAGASAIEVYSALVYHGMGLVPQIKKDLLICFIKMVINMFQKLLERMLS